MLKFQKTDIQASSHFHPFNYPALKDHLAVMDEKMANLPILHKADLLIASLKGEALNKSWTDANPAAAAMLHAQSLPVQEMTNLFAGSRKAAFFTVELESYIRNWFKVTTAIY